MESEPRKSGMAEGINCMKPLAFTDLDIGIIYQELEKQVSQGLHPRSNDFLEWGSGGSTITFPSFLVQLGVSSFTWTAIEHSKEWFDKLHRPLPRGVDVIPMLTDGDPYREPMDDYVSLPLTLGKRYSLILVDGRKRRRCLEVASKILAPFGVCILHDASREYYHCALKNFTWGAFVGTDLWIGGVDHVS